MRAFQRRLLAALALLTACTSAGVEAAPLTRLPLSDARWLLPGPEQIRALTTQPVECYRPPADAERRDRAEAGRIAFRTPLLLGGPAAKTGLSCQSCHVNGHDNPAFHVERLSAAPGTVDVTSDLFSKTRGDGVFNPVPIPSLVDRVRLRRQQEAEGEAAMLRFVHGVIEDEFQGALPAQTVFEALMAYVSSLDADACSAQVLQPLSLADDWQTLLRGAQVLRSALNRGDQALADFLLIGLRSLLGRINERFDLPGLEKDRARLLDLSRDLGRIRDRIPAAPTQAAADLAAWTIQLKAGFERLKADESRSLYQPQQLQLLLDKLQQPAAIR